MGYILNFEVYESIGRGNCREYFLMDEMEV